MAITQPTYPIATSDLVTHIGNYADSLGLTTVVAVSANYTLLASDARKVVEANSAGAIIITIPLNLNWATGEWCEILRVGAGGVTISPASGVTLESAGSTGQVTGSRQLRVQKSNATLRRRGTNLFVITGDFS